MIKEPHSHTFDEYLFFLGGNSRDIFDFHAEIELYMGQEQELHIIDKPTIGLFPQRFIALPHEF